jgi:hypothetical protein
MLFLLAIFFVGMRKGMYGRQSPAVSNAKVPILLRIFGGFSME